MSMSNAPQRGFFGKLFLWSFYGFNVLMLIWLVGGVCSASQDISQLQGAEQVGATIGTGLGAFFIIIIWVLGDIILGLLALVSRPR